MRHPVGLHDMFDINTFEHNKRHQTYVDIGGYQIVLSSGERIHCNKCIDIEGIVDIVDLEGGEGTKGSYKNAFTGEKVHVPFSDSLRLEAWDYLVLVK